MSSETRFGALRERFSRIGGPFRILVLLALAAVALLALAWIVEKVSLYFLARSYVEEIAAVFDLNPHLANALLWIAYALMAVCFWLAFSFSRPKRLAGMAGILLLLVGHSLILAYGTQRQLFARDGKAIKCYVMTRDGMRYGERPGIDPATGLECRPFTPDMAERLDKYANGNRPKRVAGEPNFFDLATGQPVVWYARQADGNIELFDLMGFHPETGLELIPVTREVVAAWKAQAEKRKQLEARRPPTQIDPKSYQFFDPLSGEPRSWYRKADSGTYEFYDRPGFDPRTGEPLTVASRDVIDAWRKHEQENPSRKCYVITRDTVRYRDQPGIDPETGRACKMATPELLERLREYEKGKRPRRILLAEPTFFDLGTGQPIVWYHRRETGQIEIFDLMGFHPESGTELVAISKDVVEAWKKQETDRKLEEERRRRPPKRIDPEKTSFFDPGTGAPRVWAWRGRNGDYEFYDNEGFHPGTGEKLTVVTREVLETWKREAEETERARKAEAERLEAAKREREAREQRERAEREQREAKERREREEQRQRETQMARRCDQLAANPHDLRRAGEGVSYDILKLQAREAVEACEGAVQQSPAELRFQYQLARALYLVDKPRAYKMFDNLVKQRYPAAYDNFGWLHLERRNEPEALRYFRLGTELGDPDSMVSLAEMIARGKAEPRSPAETKFELYRRAAELGHVSAANALRIEQEAMARAEQERIIQLQQQQQTLQFFGNVLQAIPRRP